jgi:peptidoglycan/xylan/chitin deacetylase (PgdA/CDA1 family)
MPADVPTLLLTFDNLGEAADVQRGLWPVDRPLGEHPSVVRVLPRLLHDLDRLALAATFFVEAVNAERYPEAVREIARRGHDLGLHGWTHEPWDALEPEAEAALLTRCLAAFGHVGAPVRAFRPPGGGLTPASPALLREAGLAWCSAAAGTPHAGDGGGGGPVQVPFDWRDVDALYLLPSFADRRTAMGLPRDPFAAADAGAALRRRVDDLVDDGRGVRVLILHPFLAQDDAVAAQQVALLEHVAALRAAGRLAVSASPPRTAARGR